MDDYTREMMDLKTLVTRTLEKKGVLAKIRAELRASVFEAIEEEDRTIEKEEGLTPALLGSCNDRAKQLHASPSGRLLTALISEYLDWAQLSHTLKVYLPECNLQKDFWKAELKEFSSKNGYDLNRNGDSAPLLLDVLEGFLKYENLSQARGTGRRYTPESESLTNLEARNMRRPSSSSVAGGLPPLGRPVPVSQASDRRGGSSMSSYRRDEYNWRYDSDELPEDVARASTALENLQLDRKARNLTSSWRYGYEYGTGTSTGTSIRQNLKKVGYGEVKGEEARDGARRSRDRAKAIERTEAIERRRTEAIERRRRSIESEQKIGQRERRDRSIEEKTLDD